MFQNKKAVVSYKRQEEPIALLLEKQELEKYVLKHWLALPFQPIVSMTDIFLKTQYTKAKTSLDEPMRNQDRVQFLDVHDVSSDNAGG